jgi:hypothetical protein
VLEVGDANRPATLLSKVGSEIKGWRTVRIGEIGSPSPIAVAGIRIAAASRRKEIPAVKVKKE